jgi:hypothetical protein
MRASVLLEARFYKRRSRARDAANSPNPLITHRAHLSRDRSQITAISGDFMSNLTEIYLLFTEDLLATGRFKFYIERRNGWLRLRITPIELRFLGIEVSTGSSPPTFLAIGICRG